MIPLEPLDVRDLFPGERAALLDLLAGLDAAQWAAPTVCPGWSVKDVALHLLADDLGRLSWGRDGFASPSFAIGLDIGQWSGLVAAINRQNETWVEATRRLSPRLLCDLLRFSGEETDAYYRTLDPNAIGGPVDWAGPEPAPVWLDLAREYTERWVHQQQIRDAVGRPGLTERPWLHPVLDTFVRALPHTLRDAAAPIGACVRLAIRGEAGGQWLAVRAEGGWRLGHPSGESTDAVVLIDQDLAWRLFTRGVTPEQAAPRATFAGDQQLAERVLQMVSIIA
jgi:uncharacterized protein (TIGR03083 family)